MRDRHLVLVTDRFESASVAYLMAQPEIELRLSSSAQPTVADLADAEALIIRSRTKINDALLTRAPRLRLIVSATSGSDHIDFEAITRAGGRVRVAHTPNANAASAAELTWALVLACARRGPEAHRATKSGDWAREHLIGRELSGKTYGIIGLGRIGSRVALVARAFGMRVVAFDPYRDEEWFNRHATERVGIDEIIRMADVLSVHVPSSEETRHMIHGSLLSYAQPGLIIVNTSRGTAIHEAALVEALKSGRVAAAGLDVYEKEPMDRNSPLLELNNVVFSPHIGATTHEAFAKASQEAADKVLRYFRDNELDDVLPPTTDWYRRPFARKK